MTSDEARELFSEAFDGELDDERRAAFEAALAADAELRDEWEGFREMLTETHALAMHDAAQGPTPDLLAGVQTRLRERSRGRFYRDRFATTTRGARALMPIMLGLVMLLVVVVAWVMMNAVDVEPAGEPPGGASSTQHDDG